MQARKQRPRAPHWPKGSVGRFYVKKDPARGDDKGLMAVEPLPIHGLQRIDTGWVILAGTVGEYRFQVDANGESAECVPWDDEMEREFQLHGGDIPPSYDMPEPPPEPEVLDDAMIQPTDPIELAIETYIAQFADDPEALAVIRAEMGVEGSIARDLAIARRWKDRRMKADEPAIDAHADGARTQQEADK